MRRQRPKAEIWMDFFSIEYDNIKMALACLHDIPRERIDDILIGYRTHNDKGIFSMHEIRKGMYYSLNGDMNDNVLVKWQEVKDDILPHMRHWWTRENKLFR